MRALLAPAERRLALAVFVVAFLTFAYFVQGGGPNQNSRYDLTRAIVEQRTLTIDAFHRNTFDKARVGEHHYSDKAPGLSFAAVPAHAVHYALAGAPREAKAERDGMYLATLATVSWLSAAAASALYLLLRHWRRSRFAALLAVVAWAFGTHALAYSTLFVGHQLVAACLTLSLCLLVWRAATPDEQRAAPWLLAAAGALAGWAAISEYPAAPIAGGLFVYATARLGWQRMLPFVAAAALPLGLLAGYNAACFGSPLSLGYQHLAVAEFKNVIDRGFFGMGSPDFRVVGELLGGEFRGLLPLSPVFALVPVGWVLMARQRERRLELALCGVSLIYLLLLSSSYLRWDGGAAMGPRYLVPALPFGAIALGFAFDARIAGGALLQRTLRGAAICLVGVSVALCTLVTLVLPELPDDNPTRPTPAEARSPDPRHPISQIIVPLVAEGLVSQKAVTASGAMGLAATLPGHDDDAFNWGEALGLTGLASLVPLLLWWALGAAWIHRESSRAEAGVNVEPTEPTES